MPVMKDPFFMPSPKKATFADFGAKGTRKQFEARRRAEAAMVAGRKAMDPQVYRSFQQVVYALIAPFKLDLTDTLAFEKWAHSARSDSFDRLDRQIPDLVEVVMKATGRSEKDLYSLALELDRALRLAFGLPRHRDDLEDEAAAGAKGLGALQNMALRRKAQHAGLQQMVKMAAGRAAGTPLRRPPGMLLTAQQAAQIAIAAKERPQGGAPIVIPQPVRASPPNPSAAIRGGAERIVRPPHIRASRINAPRVITGGSFQRVPVAATLQGLGIAPIAVTQMNGAPIAVSPVGSSYINGLGANADTSVSGQVRAKKALMDMGVPVSGDYTDAIRQAAGFAFGPKRMPKQGFAAASYSYPAQQMVVGSTLSGQPIVAPPSDPRPPARAAPRLVTRGGIRGQISSSPSEERRKLLSTLQGLGAVVDRPGQVPEGETPWAPGSEEARFCAGRYPPGVNAEQDMYYWRCMASGLTAPNTDVGRYFRDLPTDWRSIAKGAVDVGKTAASALKSSGGQQQQAALPTPPGGYGAGGAGYSSTFGTKKTGMSTGMMVGIGVAAVAAVGGIAYVAMKK